MVGLEDRFGVTRYLAPDSDIVALMVFEHQTQMHNRLTSSNFATRQALYLEAQMRQLAEQGDDQHLPITERAIKQAGVYSDSFQKLPSEVHDYVWQQLSEVLAAEQTPARFSHLSDTDRQDILAILRDTIPDLPASFGGSKVPILQCGPTLRFGMLLFLT